MSTIRLTAAQAMMRWLAAQANEDGERFIAGCWAIFGHGNVAGIGEALHAHRAVLPTWRGQNEQTMAHAAVAYAKQLRRRRAMMVTSSIGPGATNMVTAAATAHVNRLPLLLVPGDVFAGRAPDPVLQQIEDFGDGTISANDCFRPVSRYFDRIMRPEQLLTALPRAFAVMTDPAECGPVTLAVLPGRPGGSIRLAGGVLRAAHLAEAADPARSRRSRGAGRVRSGQPEAAPDRWRRRPLRGRLRRVDGLRGAPWRSGRGDAGRKVRSALGSSAQSRPHRRHRLCRSERHGGGG